MALPPPAHLALTNAVCQRADGWDCRCARRQWRDTGAAPMDDPEMSRTIRRPCLTAMSLRPLIRSTLLSPAVWATRPGIVSLFDLSASGLDVIHTPRAGQGMALRIGQHWWQGEPPIQQHRSNKDTLQYLLTPSMLDVIHEARLEYVGKIRPITPGRPHTPLEPDEPFFLGIACRAFAAVLLQEAGIECQVESTQHYTAVSFPYCPFCANQLPSCNLLRGVVEAMLLWAYRQPRLSIANNGALWLSIRDQAALECG